MPVMARHMRTYSTVQNESEPTMPMGKSLIRVSELVELVSACECERASVANEQQISEYVRKQAGG